MQNIISLFLVFMLFITPSNSEIEKASKTTETKKIVYLTFDDAPGGKVTKDMLKTLKDNNVNATFFLIGEQIDNNQQEIIKQMVSDGNAVGLHSYTHDHCKLYGPNGDFFKEMAECQNSIKNACGVTTNILRFPFGCNSSYFRLTKSMLNKIHSKNLKVYEWNVDSTDGLYPKLSPSKIAKRAQSTKKTAVVLMHSGYNNKNSAAALNEVIQYYKKNGYTFKTISDDTDELYRIVKKK